MAKRITKILLITSILSILVAFTFIGLFGYKSSSPELWVALEYAVISVFGS